MLSGCAAHAHFTAQNIAAFIFCLTPTIAVERPGILVFLVLTQNRHIFLGIQLMTSFKTPILLGTKVNSMASRVKGLVCLWHHEHGRTYKSHDFSGGGRSRVLVS